MNDYRPSLLKAIFLISLRARADGHLETAERLLDVMDQLEADDRCRLVTKSVRLRTDQPHP